MYRNVMRKLVLSVGLLFPILGLSASLEVSLRSLREFSAADLREEAGVMATLRANPQYFVDKGFRDKLRELGIITYPPAWEAFQKELSAMERRALYDFLHNSPPAHPVLGTFDRPGMGEPLNLWFGRNLNAKFLSEDLKGSAATERPKFDSILRELDQETAIRQRQAGYRFQLTDDEKYQVAEAVQVTGRTEAQAITEILGSIKISPHDEQAPMIAQHIVANPLVSREEATLSIKRGLFTREVEDIFGARIPAQKDAVIAHMLATEALPKEALIDVLDLDPAYTFNRQHYAEGIVKTMIKKRTFSIEEALKYCHWIDFKSELVEMRRGELYEFLDNPLADHPVLRTFRARGRDPLNVWLRQNLDEKFASDETLRSVAATERPKFDSILRELDQETAIRQRQAGYRFQLTDDEKYRVAEAVQVTGRTEVQAIAEILGFISIPRHGNQTSAIAEHMVANPLATRDASIKEIKENLFTAEVDAIFGARIPAQRDAVIARMLARSETPGAALVRVLGDAYTSYYHKYATAIVNAMQPNPALSIEDAFRQAHVAHLRSQLPLNVPGPLKDAVVPSADVATRDLRLGHMTTALVDVMHREIPTVGGVVLQRTDIETIVREASSKSWKVSQQTALQQALDRLNPTLTPALRGTMSRLMIPLDASAPLSASAALVQAYGQDDEGLRLNEEMARGILGGMPLGTVLSAVRIQAKEDFLESYRFDGVDRKVTAEQLIDGTLTLEALVNRCYPDLSVLGTNIAEDVLARLIPITPGVAVTPINQIILDVKKQKIQTYFGPKEGVEAWYADFEQCILSGSTLQDTLTQDLPDDYDIRDTVVKVSYRETVIKAMMDTLRPAISIADKKVLAEIMLNERVDTQNALRHYFKAQGCDDAILDEMITHFEAGTGPDLSLEKTINHFGAHRIRRIYPALDEDTAKAVSDYIGTNAIEDVETGLSRYFQDNKAFDAEKTAIMVRLARQHFDGSGLSIDTLVSLYAQYLGLEELSDVLSRSMDPWRMVHAIHDLSDDPFNKGLSPEEVRLKAVTNWVAETDGLDMSFVKRRQIATYIAKRMLESNQTKAQCHAEFNEKVALKKEVFNEFYRRNYPRGWSNVCVLDWPAANRKLFEPILLSNAWCLTDGSEQWLMFEGTPEERAVYEGGIIDDLSLQLALNDLSFSPPYGVDPRLDPRTDAVNRPSWDQSKQSLIIAMAGAIEYKDRGRHAGGEDYREKVKNKLLQAQFQQESKAIAEKMFVGMDVNEEAMGMPYEDAQREFLRFLQDWKTNFHRVTMLQGDANSYLDDDTTGAIFAQLFGDPRTLDVTTLSPKNQALLEDMVLLRVIDKDTELTTHNLPCYRKLARFSLQNNKNKSEILELKSEVITRLMSYGIEEEDLEKLTGQAKWNKDDREGLSDRLLLEDYYYKGPMFRDADGLKADYKSSLDYMIKYGINKEKSLMLCNLALASKMQGIGLSDDLMHQVIIAHDLPDDFTPGAPSKVKAYLETPLKDYLMSHHVADDSADRILAKVFNHAQTFMYAQIEELSAQAEDLLRAQFSSFAAGGVYDEAIGLIAGRMLIRYHLQDKGNPCVLEAKDFGSGATKEALYRKASSIKAHRGRISSLMMEQNLASEDTRDADIEPLCVALLEAGKVLGEVDPSTVRAAQVSLWLRPKFQTDLRLCSLNATPKNIEIFAAHVLKDWDAFLALPFERWADRYKQVHKVVPIAVVAYEEQYLTKALEASAKRCAEFDAAVRAMPPRPAETELKNYLDQYSAYMRGSSLPVFSSVLEAYYERSLGGQLMPHPSTSHYFNALSKLIQQQKIRPFLEGWKVKWNFFRIDPHAVNEDKEVTSTQLWESFTRLKAVDDKIKSTKLDWVIDRISNPPSFAIARSRLDRVLDNLASKRDAEKVNLVTQICDQLVSGSCDNAYFGAVDSLSMLVLGEKLSVESRISKTLRLWRLDLIDRHVADLAKEVQENSPNSNEQIEQQIFLKITGNWLLDFNFLTKDMPHLWTVRLRYLRGDEVSALDKTAKYDNPKFKFETVWDNILNKITVSNMVEHVQSIIEPLEGRGEFLISRQQFRDWATTSPMLWEYAASGNLWDEGSKLVKAGVVKAVLYGLGYLEREPARDLPEGVGIGFVGAGAPAGGGMAGAGMAGAGPDGRAPQDINRDHLPECWPKMRRLVPVGADKRWIGTDDPTDPTDPLYRR